MADRFPSLEELDEGKVEPSGDANFDALDNTDGPSDFLARERAALGEDAQQFSTVEDGDDDDDLLAVGGNAALTRTNGNSGADMMGDDMGTFESSFPAVDTQNDAVGPGGTITGSTLPYHAPGVGSQLLGGYQSFDDEAEPEVLREWRERRDLSLQHRGEVSASKKAETVKAAQEAVDEFYENYNNRKDKGIAQTRKEAEEFLKSREDTTSGGTSWERISKLVDLSGKGAAGGASGTGKAKMRELLVGLKKDEKAPGASGV